MKFKQITAEQTYNLRHKVLRKNKDLNSCKFESDLLSSTIHFGLFDKNQTVAILSLYESNNCIFSSEYQIQLRGMAIGDEYQGQGLGKMILNLSIQELKVQKPNVDLIWCNARQIAYKFYLKQGFKFESKEFEIGDIGAHRVMSRNL